jgi:hypothetical protein
MSGQQIVAICTSLEEQTMPTLFFNFNLMILVYHTFCSFKPGLRGADPGPFLSTGKQLMHMQAIRYLSHKNWSRNDPVELHN